MNNNPIELEINVVKSLKFTSKFSQWCWSQNIIATEKISKAINTNVKKT